MRKILFIICLFFLAAPSLYSTEFFDLDSMSESVYDTDDSGVVDDSEELGGHTSSYYLNAGTSFGGDVSGTYDNLSVTGITISSGTLDNIITSTMTAKDVNGIRIEDSSNNLITQFNTGAITTNGNVGINIDPPIYVLHISSQASNNLAVGLLLDNDVGGTDSATGLRFRSVSAAGDTRCKGGIFFERRSAGGIGSLHFAVEGTNDASNAELTDAKLTIDLNGNVGINDTTPSYQLDVNGVIQSTGLIVNAGQEINEFSTDGTLAGDSDTAIPTEQAVKTYVDNASPSSTDYQYQFFADQFETPNNSSWTVNALATLGADSNDVAFVVRSFDDTTEEGIGFSLYIPASVSSMTLTFVSRAETAPVAARTVGLKLYERGIPGAVDAWSAGTALTDIDITTDENWVKDTQVDSLTDWGLTAEQIHQFELTRVDPSGGTELTGDWVLLFILVEFE